MKVKAKRKQLDNRIKKTHTPRWVALGAAGTMMVYAGSGGNAMTPVYAQSNRTAVQTPAAMNPTQDLSIHHFEIAPGPLEDVVKAFQETTGQHILVLREGVLSVSSPGVTGDYTREQALQMILAGTNLTFRITGPTTALLDIERVMESVDVVAAPSTAMPLSQTLSKYAELIRDTPQSISVVPEEIMAEQGTTTLRDALRNVAGISLAAGEGGAQGDSLTVRGFTARNDLFIDGMRDFGSYYRDPFNMQEVEVLQGPSSVTFGRGSTGGVVNQASKVPMGNTFISGDAAFGADLTRRVTLDINRPLPSLGHDAAFRLNLMGNDSKVAGRDVAQNRRFGIAPSLSFGMAGPTRWGFSYLHQTGDDIPDYGVPWLFNSPALVPHHNYYGFQNGNYLRTYDDIGTARVEQDVDSHVTVRNQARYANYIRHVLITEPQIATPVDLTTPLSAMTVNRHEIGVDSTETYLDDQLDVTARFHTGRIGHTLVSGIEGGRETSDPTRPTWTNVPATSLLNPNPDQIFSGTSAITSIVQTTAVSASAYALDTLQLHPKVDLTAGLRWDRFGTEYAQSVAPASAFSRVDRMPTWRAAIVYKPVPSGSVYVDAGTSFNPSAEALSLSAATANLPPEKNRTYELGSKWDFAHDHLSFRSAVFQTVKMNAREADPTNSLLDVLAGNQRVNGFETEVSGKLNENWEVLSSYAYLDSRVVSSQFYPAAIGAQLANVPKNTFNFWTSYYWPRRWETGVGGNYVASRTASSTVPLDPTTGLVKQAPGYWVFNLMAKHPLSDRIDFQVNVNNLTNAYYYDLLHPAHVILGAGRSALAGIRFKF